MGKGVNYFLLGILFWIVVDFLTTEAIRNPIGYYTTYLPALLIFYVGYPLAFSLLIYKFRIGDIWLFIAMLIGIVIVEIVFMHNTLLYSFPMVLIGIPAAIIVYGILTFVPKWIIDKALGKNKWKLAVMAVGVVLIALASFFGKSG
jgi:hypothetical protein